MNRLEDAEGQPLCADCGKGLDEEPVVTLVERGGDVVPVCERCWVERQLPRFN